MENRKIHGYIYLLTNKINEMKYVGQTVRTIKDRFDGHISDSKHGKNYINRAIKKYGIENFKIEQVDIAYNQEELNLIEGVYMAWFNTLTPNGYNIKNIIDGKGRHSKQTIEKMKITNSKPENLKLKSKNGKKSRGKGYLNSSSKYVGVYIKDNKYVSKICLNQKNIHLGYYNIESDAAKAYDISAIKYFGHDCNLNFSELRKDYIENKIIINKNTRQTNSKSGIKGIRSLKNNKWIYRWFDKTLNKNKSKCFDNLEEAKKYKLLIETLN